MACLNGTPTGERLSIRIDPDNPLHHLWLNNGTWWVHYTLESAEGFVRRVRRSLHTRDISEAIARRDVLLAAPVSDSTRVTRSQPAAHSQPVAHSRPALAEAR